jgi:large subunit ribosomal protein L24
MPKQNIKKNTEVLVLVGKDKGKKGMVLEVNRKLGKALVSGINLRTRHLKPTKDAPGEIVLKESHIDLSNLRSLSNSQ